jgi:glc operon protein GlcG
MKRFWQGLTLLLMLAVYGVAQAQAPAYGNEVTLDMAKKVMAAAEAEAKKNNWPVVIAIVDTHGLLVMLQRIDNTQTASVNVAIEKARTAAMFKRPSKAFEDAIAGGRVALLGLPGATPIEGGLPLMQDGKIIGAIGVSGMTSPQDGQVAKAGVDAVGK